MILLWFINQLITEWHHLVWFHHVNSKKPKDYYCHSKKVERPLQCVAPITWFIPPFKDIS